MDKILKSIDNQQDKMVRLLKKWANINSGSENIKGLAKMLAVIKKHCLVLDGEMEEIPLAPRSRIDSKGNKIQIPHGRALFIKKNPQAKTQVLLAGHYDTVFGINSPFQKTELIDSNTLRGPGVADMKGGLIIMLKALEILESSPYKGKLGMQVIINPDEEIGSQGSEFLYKKAAIGKVAGLIFEPTFPDGTIVNSRKGSANFTLTTHGTAAHAGRDFEKGKSAIVALSKFIHEANNLNDLERGLTINFGHIEGGGPVNIVPDFAICQINVRILNPLDLQKTKSSFHELIKKLYEKEGIRMELHESGERAPKPLDNKTAELFDILQKVGLKLGHEIKFAPSGGVSDGNILAGVHLPTIDTLGIIGGNIHTFHEYALLDSLKEKVKLTVCLLIELIERYDR